MFGGEMVVGSEPGWSEDGRVHNMKLGYIRNKSWKSDEEITLWKKSLKKYDSFHNLTDGVDLYGW